MLYTFFGLVDLPSEYTRASRLSVYFYSSRCECASFTRVKGRRPVRHSDLLVVKGDALRQVPVLVMVNKDGLIITSRGFSSLGGLLYSRKIKRVNRGPVITAKCAQMFFLPLASGVLPLRTAKCPGRFY